MPDLFCDEAALPGDVGVDVPLGYTITYRVTAGATVTTDVLQVQRPFGSLLTTHAGDSPKGRVLSQRSVGARRARDEQRSPVGSPRGAPGAGHRRSASRRRVARRGRLRHRQGPRSRVGRRASRAGATRPRLLSRPARSRCRTPANGPRCASTRWGSCWPSGGSSTAKRFAASARVALSFDTDARLAVPEGALLPGSGELRRLADDAACRSRTR